MRFKVEEQLGDLRFKVGAALEFDRPLDLTIEGQAARVAIESVKVIERQPNSLGRLAVRFVVPNEFRLESLDIPGVEGQEATVTTYPADQHPAVITLD